MAKLNGAPAGADLRVNWDQRWSHVMAANMAPLPRIRETDRHMGLDRQAYRDQVRTQRGPLFARLFNDRQALPQLRVMVFHGLGAWRHYQFGHQFSVEPEASWPSIPGAPAFKTVCDMGRRRVIVGPSLTRASRVSCDALTEQLRVWSRQDDDWRTTI
ncbi:hypothetical protein [Frateuria aurantia]|nr:hypothetical protein [Frateuria aurantia]